MISNKIKLYIAKTQNILICLIISSVTYFVVIHLYSKKNPEDCFPEHLDKYLHKVADADARSPGFNSSLDVDVLLGRLDKLNKLREVRNVKEYGPVNPDTPFLVVRVHRGLQPLQLLVASLAQAAGVDDLLLIFSHSYYDARIDSLIHQIDYCMVLQIFYLNSVQLNPNSFPGFEPRECANGSCSSHDPRLAEPKHHWWWTVNFVFDQLARPVRHTDMVMFIEESSYVLPDLLYMLGSAKYAISYFPDVDVISLGRVPAAASESGSDYGRLVVESWRAAHNNGLAFNRSTWGKISALGWEYCEYDDTSWSQSLLHVFRRFPRGCAVAVGAAVARVLHTGALHRGPRARRRLCWLRKQFRLFPRRVQAVVLYGRRGKVLSPPEAPPKGSGGWSDHRDVFHCYEVTIVEETVTTAFPEPD